MAKTVWVLRISTPNDDDIQVHSTYDGAFIALVDYVKAEWDDGLTEQYGGDADFHNHDDLIEYYFDAYASALDPEFYTLEETTIQTMGRR